MPRILAPVCTLAVYFQVSPELPVVVAANRDEFYERPALPPAQIADDPWVVAGRDLTAGGTWLGVNGHALLAGILNRRTPAPPDPTRRSRGLLCLEVLRSARVETAVDRTRHEPGDRYNAFNLLIASPQAAAVVGNVSGAMTAAPLRPGLHLLTNLDLNDPECPRIAKSYALFDAARRLLREDALDELRAALQRILADHSTPLDPRSDGPPNNLCVHGERFGTRSSTLLVYSARARRFRMWHAPGAPCQHAHAEVALPVASRENLR
jgi:uncharacterized protein with NRDE domain